MRVLFDGHWWLDGPTSNREVLKELVRAWIVRFPEDEIFLTVPVRDAPSVRRDLDNRVTVVPTRIPLHGLSVIFELPLVARRVRSDISITHNFTPLLGNSAVFIHDVLFQTNPSWFTKRERAYFALIPMSSRRANHVFTSTTTEATRIKQQNPALKDPAALGLGLSHNLITAEPSPPPLAISPFSFALCVGRLNVRKNLAITLSAAVDSGLYTVDSPLVVVGEKSGKSPHLPQDVIEAIEVGSIIFAGYVSNSELSWMYENTRTLLFMTLGEGFGLPALEAIWFGAPLLVSDIPVLREVCGPHATYVDPTNKVAIVAALQAVVPRSAPHDALSGREYIEQRYEWSGSVEVMRQVIESTARRTRS
jgi:glycosyltransferase involved in cell wall biosynthesis